MCSVCLAELRNSKIILQFYYFFLVLLSEGFNKILETMTTRNNLSLLQVFVIFQCLGKVHQPLSADIFAEETEVGFSVIFGTYSQEVITFFTIRLYLLYVF